jgi:putative addiction module component (TIGR02574 family)
MTHELDISRLTPAERILLAEQLGEQSRANARAIPVAPEQMKELHHRLDALDAGTIEPGESWEVVQAHLWGDEAKRYYHASRNY